MSCFFTAAAQSLQKAVTPFVAPNIAQVEPLALL
jgi:hypothetical protein